MTIDVDTLSQGLAEFSPSANDAMNVMVAQGRKLAFILLGIFFLIELADWREHFKREGGNLSLKIGMEIAWKYVLAFVFIVYSTYFLNGLIWLYGRGLNLIDGAIASAGAEMTYESGDVGGIHGIILDLVGWVVFGIAEIISGTLIFVIFLGFFMLKFLGPIAAAFFVSNHWSSVSMNWWKLAGVYALQALLLLVVSKIYPLLMVDDVLKLVATGRSSIGVTISSIAKGVIFIITLTGTNRYVSRLFGV